MYEAYSKFAKTLAKHSSGEHTRTPESDHHEKLLAHPLPSKSIKLSKLVPSAGELITLVKRNFATKFSTLKRLQIYLIVPLVLGMITLSTSNPGFPKTGELTSQKASISTQVGAPGSSADRQLKRLLSPNPLADQRSGQQFVYELKHETVANLPISLSTLLILTMTAIFCGTLTACLELSTEKNIFLRERMAGQKTVNYFFSKIPFLFLLAAVQMTILLVVCAFDDSLRQLNLFTLCIALISISWVAVCLGLLVSALDPSDGQYSVVIAIAVILPQLVLGGALGPDYYLGMSDMTQAVANVLPAKWGMEVLMSGAFADVAGLSWIKTFAVNEMGLNFDAAVYFRAFIAYAFQMAVYLSITFYLLERRSPLG